MKFNFTIENSHITAYNMYNGSDLALDARRDKEKAYFKGYHPNKVLKYEGWVSLDKTNISAVVFQNNILKMEH